MNTRADYSKQQISPQEQALYDHLLACVNSEGSKDLIERFKALFIEATGYADREILTTLDQIAADKQAEQYFCHILNRCCHILINRWQAGRHHQSAILELIQSFETGPTLQVRELSRMRPARRLRELTATFKETEQYTMLKRLGQVIENAYQADQLPLKPRPLGSLIGRYPYLYEHCLLSEDSPETHQANVRRIQSEAQHQFELDLSQYVTYRVRRAKLKRNGELDSLGQNLRPAANPTLLSDRDLVASLNQFTGKVERRHTYRDLAYRFMSRDCQGATFRSFKDSLYDYITASIDTDYGRRKFNNLLHQQLTHICPENNHQKLNDFLMVRTCTQLFNFLVVDSSPSRQHYVFVDLINNIGPILTTGILVKILLLCRKVKPALERRFSILFNHYEAATQDTVTWLVNVLENLNIALSLNFGTLDLSHTLV